MFSCSRRFCNYNICLIMIVQAQYDRQNLVAMPVVAVTRTETLYGVETEVLIFEKRVVRLSASMEQLTTYSVDERMFNELFQQIQPAYKQLVKFAEDAKKRTQALSIL